MVQGNKEADIVQLGLMEEEDSQVYLAARRLADTRPEVISFNIDCAFDSSCPPTSRPCTWSGGTAAA